MGGSETDSKGPKTSAVQVLYSALAIASFILFDGLVWIKSLKESKTLIFICLIIYVFCFFLLSQEQPPATSSNPSASLCPDWSGFQVMMGIFLPQWIVTFGNLPIDLVNSWLCILSDTNRHTRRFLHMASSTLRSYQVLKLIPTCGGLRCYLLLH